MISRFQANRGSSGGLFKLLVEFFNNGVFDVGDDLFRFLVAPVHQQPSRAFGNEFAQIENSATNQSTDAEPEPPANRIRNYAGIKDDYGGRRTGRRAKPEAAVDDQIDAAAQSRGNQFIDGGV